MARFFLLSAAIACGSSPTKTEKLERLDVSKEVIAASSAKANQFFEQMFQEQVESQPDVSNLSWHQKRLRKVE